MARSIDAPTESQGGERAGAIIDRAVERFSVWNRRRKLRWVRGVMGAMDLKMVLLIGVTPTASPWENIVELGVAQRAEVAVASGVHPPAVNCWDRYVVCDGLRLPFRHGQFDLVLSNAVIEHVGDQEQAQFLREHDRVGRVWIATTPNRWFPVESHTRVLIRHWRTGWRDGQGAFTRLLSRGELANLLPHGAAVKGSFYSPTLSAIGGERRV